jgi:hypothetical protein
LRRGYETCQAFCLVFFLILGFEIRKFYQESVVKARYQGLP